VLLTRLIEGEYVSINHFFSTDQQIPACYVNIQAAVPPNLDRNLSTWSWTSGPGRSSRRTSRAQIQ
jgi:hypothetical protein